MMEPVYVVILLKPLAFSSTYSARDIDVQMATRKTSRIRKWETE
jgi:hypothetical protein